MHSLAQHRHGTSGQGPATETRGLVMDMGWRYDLMVGFFDTVVFRGKLRELRQRALDLAQLQAGEAALDVGCGTGTLALLAKERVGTTGHVAGIDPGPRQIARARAKAARRRAPIDFQVGVIERLPFPDRSFDAVFSTLMMHHLPDDLKRQGLVEIARVLKPGGRLVMVDFKHGTKHEDKRACLGAGTLGLQDQPALLEEAGFSKIDSGDVRLPRFPGLAGAGFVRGYKAPAGSA